MLFGESPPRFASAMSTHPLAAAAVGEAIGQVLDEIGVAPDLAVLFVSGDHLEFVQEILSTIHQTLAPRSLVGGSASGVLGQFREVEGGSAIALWCANVGNVLTVSLQCDGQRLLGWPSEKAAEASACLLLSDPFSFASDTALDMISRSAPGLTVVGGALSAGNRPGMNILCRDRELMRQGAVAVLFPPGCLVDPVVSQGCRPVGRPFVVTGASGRVVTELGSMHALDRFDEMVGELSPDDRSLLRKGIFIGVVVNEQAMDFTTGDFLIRGVLGADRSARSIVLGEEVPVGTTVQFHVRDADAARDDLHRVLSDAAQAKIRGSLVFTCTGRGKNLFGEPNVDAETIGDFTNAPHTGMFCAGEYGPVGPRLAVHTFSLSALLFR
jgi:small ligand-binding sensory domain FIST